PSDGSSRRLRFCHPLPSGRRPDIARFRRHERDRAVQGIAGTMPAFGDGVRAAVLAFAVLAFAAPALAQTSRKEPPPRPPLDIKPALKNAKPVKDRKSVV